jgi:hypothetical protein
LIADQFVGCQVDAVSLAEGGRQEDRQQGKHPQEFQWRFPPATIIRPRFTPGA